MKCSRCVSIAAGMMTVVVALFFGANQSAAQQIPDLPSSIQGSMNGIKLPNGMPTQPMMVTNADFKRFKPSYEFDPSQAMVPVVVTDREAQDYASWSGKKMGVDLLWRVIPRSKKGVIYLLASGLFSEGAMVGATSKPTAPPGMVYIPEGSFVMGSDLGDADELPKRNEAAGPLYLDKFEVSNAEFKQVFPDFQFEAGRENCPAVVTWDQANAYAGKVGKRLPTETEWEKAARGTDGRTFPWGESWDPSFTRWDDASPRGGAIARPESPYGCVDMAGSVWEWTADWYKQYPGNVTPSDDYGEKYRVIRGGAIDNDVAMLRASHRAYLPPNTTGGLRVGFRCAKDYKP